VHRVAEAGGVVPGATEAEIPPELRARLKAIGIRAGRFALFMPDLLKPRQAALRAQLWAVRARVVCPVLPAPGLVSVTPTEDAGCLRAIGWVNAGPVMLRLDIAERLAAELHWATRTRPVALPPRIASRLSVPAASVPAVLHALGLRLIPSPALGPNEYGPPTPPMIAAPRKRAATPVPERATPRPDGPFAALAALRR
jgi:ATP-dependent RNA helicase SUPV3L1/SUV3